MEQQTKPRWLDKANFSLRKKPLVSTYNTTSKLRNYLNRAGGVQQVALYDLSTFTNGGDLDRYFRNPGSQNNDVIVISDTLYSTNRIYANILDYLRDMYYYRYVVTPRKVRNFETAPEASKYKEMYQKMLEVVEGLSIETTFPTILLNIFKNGQVFIYCWGNKTSKTITTLLLPNKFCRATNITQFGTQEIDFDFSFFDSLGLSNTQKEMVFELFPPEFKELYDISNTAVSYGSKWQHLNGKRSTCISMNESGFPTFLSVFYDLIDYKTYKLNELDKSTNMLERIVSQEIDLESSGLELDEVHELHDSMASIVCDNHGTKLVTTVGKLDVHQLQESDGIENKVLTNAYDSIYDNAGLNRAIFSGETSEAINISLTRDLNFVWSFIERLVSFYNLAINNIFSFTDYQVSLRLLPISPYNEGEKINQYRENATLGVGIIDSIMATGIKQVDLESTLELEEFLGLTERLKPLQSSHTQSSSAEQANSEESKKDEETTEDTPNDGAAPLDEEEQSDTKETDSEKE